MAETSEPSNALPADDAVLEQLRTALTPTYAVEGRIGEGMLGIVFRVLDASGRSAVVKVLRPQLVRAVGTDVALGELRVAARLSHPNILPILSVGEMGGLVYYVAPFVDGSSLQCRIDERGPLPPADAIRIVREVADAASYAHRHGVLHRDINPANVLLKDGTAIVKDFWIARALARALPEGMTISGVRLGSPAYMSPEQTVRSPTADERTDVYSLACLLFVMLTGHPPFTDAWERSTIPGLPPRAVAELARVMPLAIPAIERALSTSPGKRFDTPEQFFAALQMPVLIARHMSSGDFTMSAEGSVFGGEIFGALPRGETSGAAPGKRARRRRFGQWLREKLSPAGTSTSSQEPAVVDAPQAPAVVSDPAPQTYDPVGRLKEALRYRYGIKRHVGRGGMADVYLADDLRYRSREVALKVLRPELAASVASERFLQEIDIAARLTHPLILPLFDSGDADGMLYYAMPFLEGTSLYDTIQRKGRLPINDLARVAADVAAALDYAHRKGVIHRDVKPENILLYEGQALLADFGIALALDRAGTRLSRDGSPGTPLYMSPEQIWFPERMDYRSDIYSLGCVVFEMITGQPPFVGGFQMVAASHLHAPVPHARAKRQEISDELDLAVCKALAKEPEQRFQSVLGFASAVGDACRSGVGRRTEPSKSRTTGIGDGPSASSE